MSRAEVARRRAGEGDPGTLELSPPEGRTVPLRYVCHQGRYFVFATGTLSPWSLSSLRAGGAKVRLPGEEEAPVRVRLVTDPTVVREVEAAFRASVGEEVWRRHFARATKLISLDPREAPVPPGSRERIREEFDAIADHYTAANQGDARQRYLKRRSRQVLFEVFQGRDPLLEIGCGSGLETLPLLQEGHTVTAVDLSPRMVEAARARAREAGVASRFSAYVGSLTDLPAALPKLPSGHFAGAYSTYGAFDLEEELGNAPGELARLLRTGSPLFLACLNPHALTPALFELLQGRPSAAAQRWSRKIPAGRVGNPLDLFPRTLTDWKSVFAPYFTLERKASASVLAPPWNPDRWLEKLSASSRRRLSTLDARLAASWPGASAGEWTFLTFRRSPQEVP